MAKDPEDQTGTPTSNILPLHVIPEDLLKEWINLPINTIIHIPITKSDIDKLFFAISNTQSAIDETNRSFVQWSNNNIVEAQESVKRSQLGIFAGVNSLRQFLHSIAERMIRGDKGG